MCTKDRDLGHGIIERRFYDETGRLVDIRKIYPSEISVNGPSPIRRWPGSIGGHEY